MNKRTLAARLSVFAIGLPAILFIVFIKPHAHLALHVLICTVCGIGANELYNIFSKQIKLLPRVFLVALSVFIPLVASLVCILPTFIPLEIPHGQEIITYALIVSILLVLAYEVFTAKAFETSNATIAASCFIVLYTGYLLTFISRITVFHKSDMSISTHLIATYLLMVFLCDSFAWLFGVLLGKNNRGFIKASPNKSIAGFIGGFVGSISAGIFSYFMWQDVYEGSIFKIILVSLCIAFASIVGDLAESIFKRSSQIKDSGKIIPGRGGILDSIDSLLMAAPIYYFLISLLYHPDLGF